VGLLSRIKLGGYRDGSGLLRRALALRSTVENEPFGAEATGGSAIPEKKKPV
jgi:hypothetical protein